MSGVYNEEHALVPVSLKVEGEVTSVPSESGEIPLVLSLTEGVDVGEKALYNATVIKKLINNKKVNDDTTAAGLYYDLAVGVFGVNDDVLGIVTIPESVCAPKDTLIDMETCPVIPGVEESGPTGLHYHADSSLDDETSRITVNPNSDTAGSKDVGDPATTIPDGEENSAIESL